jgi:hypothetical protein
MLDPASATVAFIGFAASLEALVAVAATSSKGVYRLWCSFRDAIETLYELLEIVKEDQLLLSELRALSRSVSPSAYTASMQSLWLLVETRMQTDLNLLNGKIAGIQNTPASTHRQVRARFKTYFGEKGLDEMCQKICFGIRTILY